MAPMLSVMEGAGELATDNARALGDMPGWIMGECVCWNCCTAETGRGLGCCKGAGLPMPPGGRTKGIGANGRVVGWPGDG
ncbi:hypothetical protein BC940DRAFT_288401 [Gongronella butleri]|nr:hypothetical protein BC940DRAFT_288401 [Gongronella butleri]